MSSGPYMNLPVKVWGPSSLAMVSLILWLAVTFCTRQEGRKKKKPNSLQQWITSQGNAKYNRTNWSMGFSVPFPPSTPPSALGKNLTRDRGEALCPALMGGLECWRANFHGRLYVQF